MSLDHPIVFLRRMSRPITTTLLILTCCCVFCPVFTQYLSELVLLDYDYLKYTASVKAAAALLCARMVLGVTDAWVRILLTGFSFIRTKTTL